MMKISFGIMLILIPTLASAQSVDLLYQGVGSAPPFYQGGVPWSFEGSILFYAVPQGLGNPANLNYKWIKDGTVLGSVSGVGQNVLASNDPLFGKPQTIQVQIVDGDDNIIARRIVTVVPSAPEALVYEESPLFGFLFNREVSGAFPLAGQEATFAAFPFSFSARGRDDGTLSYSWRSRSGEDSAASSVTYRAPEGVSGQAAVSLKVANPSTIRQSAEKGFTITFGNEK